jgi:predicted Ser/Thr protein kinase
VALYPTCVRCYESVSDLDGDGFCTRCSVASKKSLAGTTKAPAESTRRDEPPALDSNATKSRPAAELTTVGAESAGIGRGQSIFRNYRDVQFLDRGGMGVVYRAVQETTDRTVAIKTLTLAADGDERANKRFLTESKALAKVTHPAIVQIYEVGEDVGSRYFSMEYVSGGSLAKRMKNGPPLTIDQSVEICAIVASALFSAHKNKVIHRDIKPSNILLTDAGKPKLTDFGLAAFYEQAARMTKTGTVLGTPAYMAPEQADGRRGEVGPAADIYALGATLYELITGKPPFAGENPVAVAVKVVKEPPKPPRALNPAVSPELNDVVMRCLEKDPRDRYPNAAELANDLFRVIRHEPIGKPHFATLARKFVRKNRIWLVGLGLVLVAAAAAIIVKPEDPKAKLLRLVKAGERFDLPLDAKGLPAYVAWRGLPVPLGSPAKGVWGFKTDDEAYLELLPDSWHDRYTVSLDFRQMSAANEHSSRVGVFLMRDSPPPDPERLQRLTQIRLHDWPRRREPVPGMRQLFVETGYSARGDGNRPEIGVANGVSGANFPPGDQSPVWRRMTVSVAPDGMRVTLANASDPETLLVDQFSKLEWLAKNPPELLEQPAVKLHGGLAAVPAWQPRCRVGVFAAAASVEFRNVAVTPDR